MKKIIILIMLCLSFGGALYLFINHPLQKFSRSETNAFTPPMFDMTVAGKALKVRVAKTQEEHRVGLSETTNLPKDEGMLFVFPTKPVSPPFWMKGMSISIDIVWIKDMKIIQIDEKISPPEAGALDRNLKIYLPKEPVDYVLEIAAGYSSENKLKVGDSVSIPF